MRVQRGVAARAEDRGEEPRVQAAQHQVGVGDRRGAAPSVAGRAGVGAGAGGAGAGAHAVEAEDRAAAGRHGLHVEHRRAQLGSGHTGGVAPLQRAGVAAYISRGAAHVEAEHRRCPDLVGGAGHADHPAGRAGDHRVAAAERLGPHQAAGRGHEVERRAGDRVGHAPDVGLQHWRQIGVGHSGLGAGDEAGEGGDLGAQGDEGEAGGAGDLAGALFVGGVQVGVQEGDGGGGEALGDGGLQADLQRALVQRPHDRAVGGQPLGGLDDAGIERGRPHDVEGEQVRPRLVPDQQAVGEAFGGDEQGAGAAALQQRIGGDRGAHLDRLDTRGGKGRARGGSKNPPHGFDSGVLIGRRGRQQLQRELRSVVGPADHVGEGAAPIDPEGQPPVQNLTSGCDCLRGAIALDRPIPT